MTSALRTAIAVTIINLLFIGIYLVTSLFSSVNTTWNTSRQFPFICPTPAWCANASTPQK